MYKKSMVHVQSCCFANQSYWFFLRSRYRPRRWILKTLLSEGTLEKTFRSINSPGLSMLEHKNLKR